MRYMNILAITVFSLMCLISGCDEAGFGKSNEFVMCDGMNIRVVGELPISVTATGKTTRNYKTGNTDVTVDLIPRTERWYGSFGLYRPSGTSNLHMVLEEGQQHFYTEKEALEWLAVGRWPPETKVRYTADGLVIAWANPEDVLQVDVWQVYIHGEKPQYLPGSSTSEIAVSMPADKTMDCARVGDFSASAPEEISGRLFSGHALDLMKEREVSAAEVNELISREQGTESGEFMLYLGDAFKAPRVVILDKNGGVVSII